MNNMRTMLIGLTLPLLEAAPAIANDLCPSWNDHAPPCTFLFGGTTSISTSRASSYRMAAYQGPSLSALQAV